MGTEIAQASVAGAVTPAARAEARTALRAAWRALWSSRLVVLASGLVAVLATGEGLARSPFDPGSLTRPFGAAGNLLANDGVPAAMVEAFVDETLKQTPS